MLNSTIPLTPIYTKVHNTTTHTGTANSQWHSTVLASRETNSRGSSSLAPSDSASQPKLDFTVTGARASVEALLQSVEWPTTRPEFLPETILWDYDDCEKDTSAGLIVTEDNKRRPKMRFAIRRPNGTRVSDRDYRNIRTTTDYVVQKLLNSVISSPNYVTHPCKLNKTSIKTLFQAEYDQAVLELESKQKLLRLCSDSWKADTMIGQSLLRRAGGKSAAKGQRSSKSKDSRPLEPSHATAASHVWDAAPANAAKRALEQSPGPKSPSTSRVQKRSKDGTVPSQPTSLNALVLSGDSEYYPLYCSNLADALTCRASTTHDNPIVSQPR